MEKTSSLRTAHSPPVSASPTTAPCSAANTAVVSHATSDAAVTILSVERTATVFPLIIAVVFFVRRHFCYYRPPPPESLCFLPFDRFPLTPTNSTAVPLRSRAASRINDKGNCVYDPSGKNLTSGRTFGGSTRDRDENVDCSSVRRD
jgi:hypothetical protein